MRTGIRGLPILLLAVGSWGLAENLTDPREIALRSVARDQANWDQARDYTFVERVEVRHLGRNNQVKSVESDTYDVIILERQPFHRKIAHGDQPLTGKEKTKAEKEFSDEVRKRLGGTPEQRRKKLEEFEKERARFRAMLGEIPEAYKFTLVGEEPVGGHMAYVIAGEPRPGYVPESRLAKFLPAFRGRVWIEKEEFQWVKAEIESVKPVSIGWFVARLGKGARVSFESTRVSDEVWLPKTMQFSGVARIMLVARRAAEVKVQYSDYRKFETDVRILVGTPEQREAPEAREAKPLPIQ